PEYLPDNIHPVRDERQLDQLRVYMKTHSDVLVIDVRQEMLRAKNKERLYHWTDSHWNDLGSFLACQVVIDRLRALYPALQPYDESDFVRTSRTDKGWGLAIQLGLQDVLHEEKLICKPKDGWPQLEMITEGLPPPKGRSFEGEPPFALEQDIDDGLDVVVFRDSFFNNLTKYFAPHFRRSVYYWQYDFDIDVIEHEQPDIVFQEILERELIRLKPINPLGIKSP
ncbi:MAG: alginate O-acetyltransferase AlgX-related protein, partial [Planctomycetota bacterium]